MEIFKTTCPSCEKAFDCDVALLAAWVSRLRCPWCGTYFDRGDSPRIVTGREGGYLSWEQSAGALKIAEFDPYERPPGDR
jgi:hypothetical protein